MFSVARPPAVPGLYALVNRTAGYLYIGQSKSLRARYTEWVYLFSIGVTRNKQMVEVMRATTPTDWGFVVLQELPDADQAALLSAERIAITAAQRAHGTKVLNDGFNAAYPRGKGSQAKSTVTGLDGQTLTRAEVGAALGVSDDAVKCRLKRLRGEGVTQISLEDLLCKFPRRNSPDPSKPKVAFR